ncbi:Aldo/keto reductase [Corynespora cassiicola Philippines]|uniref:Aldo/keto reductase n=1 Tax=Corynespora cassiicola Philippines TaxID=1448308 RepID=A0A2T2NBV7_CORCC|nr:Aldo/keto reductase [Corynespora cassiicola Philippines]
MATPSQTSAKTAHVNMMTDTVIQNLPADILRSVMRAILTTDSSITPIFEHHTRNHLRKLSGQPMNQLFAPTVEGVRTTSNFTLAQQRIRATVGCGLVYESLPMLKQIVEETAELSEMPNTEGLLHGLASIDGDIVQALTAVQKSLLSSAGSRDFTDSEKQLLDSLLESLVHCREKWSITGQEYPFERSASVLASILGHTLQQSIISGEPWRTDSPVDDLASKSLETFKIKTTDVPRLFSGLWQLSSPSWGVASQSQMFKQFVNYISRGFTAFDMADHYGDAEVIFGRLRSSYHHPQDIFGATKYCVFHHITVTPEVVRANVTERCQRLGSDKVDLLQFHWQHYDDPQYIQALQLLQQDDRVRFLGLCNFDTQRLQEVIDSRIDVVTNQVQFSLIDARPRFKMGAVCEKHNVKLLTYGTLCGGFLADKWLNQPEPQLFGPDRTPSQRKYFEMIQAWGSWDLFQSLLRTLKSIAVKHQVSISNVASRWVLDFPYVGAVIVGARMGVSEHTEENLRTYGWTLDEQDKAAIEGVLEQSRRKEMFESMGDCGSEYR